MEISAKIPTLNRELLATLSASGLKVKEVRGGFIVTLQKKGGWGMPEIYPIPEGLEEATFLLNLTEHGGANTNTGTASIVCGLSGKALKPYYVPTSGHLSNGDHAFFSVPGAVITITASRRQTEIQIEKHELVREGGVIKIVTTTVWSGDAFGIEWKCPRCDTTFVNECPDTHQNGHNDCFGQPVRSKLSLPERLDHYQAAALAARSKANDYHCRTAWYIQK